MGYKQDAHNITSEHGQSLVEFAVGLVVLLVLLTGIVDAGRALYAYLSMRDAAQEGALYASIMPEDTAGIESRVRGTSDYMNGLGAAIIVTTTPTISGTLCSGTSPSSGDPYGIMVTIDYPQFPLVMPFIGVFIGGQSVPIGVSVTDTILKPRCP
jgi:Flp pilus assembly protein TadG